MLFDGAQRILNKYRVIANDPERVSLGQRWLYLGKTAFNFVCDGPCFGLTFLQRSGNRRLAFSNGLPTEVLRSIFNTADVIDADL